MEAVDLVGNAVRITRVAFERPAVLLEAGDRIGDGNEALELLDRAIDQRAMRPRAAVRDIKMIAAGLGLEARRAVRGDAVAEHAVHALELAGLAGFLRQFAVGPFAVDEYAHDTAARDMKLAITFGIVLPRRPCRNSLKPKAPAWLGRAAPLVIARIAP